PHGLDAGDFDRARIFRHEDTRRHAEAARGISDRDAVIAARSGDDASRRDRMRQEIVECAPWLEGAGMLHQLELQDGRDADAERAGAELDTRRFADLTANATGGAFDILGRYSHFRAARLL